MVAHSLQRLNFNITFLLLFYVNYSITFYNFSFHRIIKIDNNIYQVHIDIRVILTNILHVLR